MATASWLAASASSQRPRSERRRPTLFRLIARWGRKASGRLWARRLLMSMASWLAASASSRRPRSERRIARSEERRGGEEGRSRWSPYHLKKKREESSAVDRRRYGIGTKDLDL